MKAKDLAKQLMENPDADVMTEKEGDLIDVNHANYFRDEAYNDVEYFVLSDEKLEPDRYEDYD